MDHKQESQIEIASLLASIEDTAERFFKDRGGLAIPRKCRAFEGDALPKPEYSRVHWQELANLGWPGILAPEDRGGLGLGIRAAAAVARKVGQWLAPEPYTVTAGVAVTLLSAANSGAAQALLDSVIAGERIVGIALDLDDRQQAVSLPRITDDAGDGGRRLYGEAPYVAPVDPVDGWLIAALDEHGLPLLAYVGASDTGVNVEPRLEVDGRCQGKLIINGMELKDSSVIAEGDAMTELLGRGAHAGRILYAAELLGAAERLQEITLEHLRNRSQFGKPIGSFQVLQHRCVDVHVQIELARASLDNALEASVLAPEGRPAHGAAIQAKLRACRAAMDAALAAVHLHGAMGTTDECDVGLYFKRILSLLPRFGSERELQSRWLEQAQDVSEEAQSSDEWEGNFPRSADWTAMPDEQFRRMVRAFLQRYYPPHLRYMPRRVHWDEIGDWYLCLSRQGWIAPAWPAAHGGMGLQATKLIAWHEELEAYGVARAPDQGILMVGPILMHYGTAEQRAQFLPRILSGENIWCQGYSEPNSGSDLASLRTEAVVEGDHFVVTGQKIWTTLAQDATHIFMLVRTDKSAKPQAGISFLLCDLTTPGITVRPITDLAGHSEFCEVFFEAVRVPRENLVGQLNEGWTIAKALLGFERLHLGSPKQSQYALGQLRKLAESRGLMCDPAFRSSYAELAHDVADLVALYTKYADYVKRGERLPPSVSMLKIWATETYQRIGLAMVRHAGPAGGLAGAVGIGDGDPMYLLAPLFNASAAKIYGGSNEVQRNILARTVLELPA
jgi:alkylation response protein AidB-like acyl-CoA dehydrogenase